MRNVFHGFLVFLHTSATKITLGLIIYEERQKVQVQVLESLEKKNLSQLSGCSRIGKFMNS